MILLIAILFYCTVRSKVGFPRENDTREVGLFKILISILILNMIWKQNNRNLRTKQIAIQSSPHKRRYASGGELLQKGNLPCCVLYIKFPRQNRLIFTNNSIDISLHCSSTSFTLLFWKRLRKIVSSRHGTIETENPRTEIRFEI